MTFRPPEFHKPQSSIGAVLAARVCLLRPFQANISLKAEQRSSIEAVYNGHDVFVWLPTGYGKSLGYQALPISSSLVPRPSTREEGLGTRLLQALAQLDLILRLRLDPAHLFTSRNIYSVLITRMRRQCVPGHPPALKAWLRG